MINIPYKELDKRDNQSHPAVQFLEFTGIFIVVMILGNLIGAGIIWVVYGLKTLMAFSSMNLNAPNFMSALWILQFVGTTLPIFVTPVFFAWTVVRDPADYLKPSFRFPWLLLVLAFVIMFASAPLIEVLSNINQKMVLPHFLKWMRDSEDSAQKITDAMLQMKNVWALIFDVLFIGLLTAVAEEFMFRGVIQTIFVRWTKNVHAAVWITAILFSAFHMEFFGFLPRLLLGALFGYMVAWSGSIWLAVWGHFINNATDVVMTYLTQHKIIGISVNDDHVFNYACYILSPIIVLFLFWLYRRVALKKQPALQ